MSGAYLYPNVTMATEPGAITASGGNVTYGIGATKFALDSRFLSVNQKATQPLTGNDPLTGERYKSLKQNEACAFLLCLKPNAAFSDAAAQAVQGDIVRMDAGKKFLDNGAPLLPPVPEGSVPVGYIVVGTNAAAGWIPGTTDWNTTGITVKSGPLVGIPGRPIFDDLT